MRPHPSLYYRERERTYAVPSVFSSCGYAGKEECVQREQRSLEEMTLVASENYPGIRG